jgi:4-hydroxybutyryl-CoA dehydratase/vinylacetyl-CoA-Delta-isomerase
MVTMPSEKDLENPATGKLIDKYLCAGKSISAEKRMRILRLIENMTLGAAAVGYRTESMHGAGSPQAQRIMISRQANIDHKKLLRQD